MRAILTFCVLVICFSAKAQTYAIPPYEQNFEKWISMGGINNVPDNHWVNGANTGNLSWRRSNDGVSANWSNTTNGMYSPAAVHGAYSARFHVNGAGSNIGSLDLFLNFDSANYTKWFTNTPFIMNFDRFLPNATDTLWIQVSDTGPNGNFINFRTITANKAIWVSDTINFYGFKSATTVVRFKVKSTSGNLDIGLDNVMIQNGDKFSELNITSNYILDLRDTAICLGQKFRYFTPDKVTPINGFSYPNINRAAWLYSLEFNSDSNYAAGGGMNAWDQTLDYFGPSDYIDTFLFSELYVGIATSYLRGIYPGNFGSTHYLCGKVGHITLRPWYECYCQPDSANGNDYFDIGCVQVVAKPNTSPSSGVVLNNTTIASTDTFNNDRATNFHNHFFNNAPTNLYVNGSYEVSITNISQYNKSNSFTAGNAMYIDFNGNNTYEANEQVGNKNVNANGNGDYTTTFSFTVPGNAKFGKTGMRVIALNQQPASGIGSCANTFDYGEVEDYVVNILDNPIGISLFELQGINIYPTVVADKINISALNLQDNFLDVQVTNLSGQILFHTKLISNNNAFNKNINLPFLNSGFYFVKLSNKQGNMSRKIIVQ